MPRGARRISDGALRAGAMLARRLDAPARGHASLSHDRRQRARPSPYHTDSDRTYRCTVSARLSNFARSLSVETAFTVLALARSLKAAGKDVVELEIGDSPFDSTAAARAGGIDAIKNNQSHYCPSPGIPEFRAAAAEFVREEFGIPAEPEQHRRGRRRQGIPAVLLRGVLESRRRRARLQPVLPDVRAEHRAARRTRRADAAASRPTASGPTVADIERFLKDDPSPRAIFLNSPHNPTGGVATEDDLKRHRRLRSRPRRRGVQRRALLPHGLARQPPLDPEPAGHARAVRRRVHVQQVVQHERLAARLRRRLASKSPT